MTNDPDDRHVLAAAVAGGISTIVTDNAKDYPTAALRTFGVTAITSGRFLADLYGGNPDRVRLVLEQQSAAYRNPPISFVELIAELEPNGGPLTVGLTLDVV
jgi:hypothetical protein